jgi:hypothetical protein
MESADPLLLLLLLRVASQTETAQQAAEAGAEAEVSS